MRRLIVALIVLGATALLTLLALRGLGFDSPATAQRARAIADFALAETTLRRDVLQARAGLLSNYDSLGAAIRAMEQATADLDGLARAANLDAGPTRRLAEAVAAEAELTERFKSANAQLRNSLSYVGLLGAEASPWGDDARMSAAAAAISALIQKLTLDTSAESRPALDAALARFAASAPQSGPAALRARALLSHASLLGRLLPEVDALLRTLLEDQSRAPLREAEALFSVRQAADDLAAWRYRLWLYVVSLLLLCAIVALGLRLRGRALAQRRLAAFEHAIAETSARLIGCPADELEAGLARAVEDLGRAAGVDRAYLLRPGPPTRALSWRREAAPCPAGWPEGALALASDESGVVSVVDSARLPPGALKQALTLAGVRGWTFAPLSRPGRRLGALGFETLRPARGGRLSDAAARLAGEAVAGALERDELERERLRLTTRLERARRMQAVGAIASGVAHNFNNVIGAILGFSEMTGALLPQDGRPARYVEEIRRAAERGRNLIDAILAFGRRGEARGRRVAISDLIAETTALLEASLPSSVELAVEATPGLCVRGEFAQLQQMILNLCANAAQALAGEGRIALSAERRELAAALALSHGELSPGRYVRLSVADTGCGFDESVARRLFEPFFTTRAAGTGLGLATVREIVREHEGAMHVWSAPGEGARFEAWLPEAGVEEPPPLDLQGQGQTVLLLEREPARLHADEETLAALGYEPVGFTDLSEAVAACRAAPERFDVLLVGDASADQGLAAARALHACAPGTPLLLATPALDGLAAPALAEAQIAEWLRLPLQGAEAARALRQATNARIRLQP